MTGSKLSLDGSPTLKHMSTLRIRRGLNLPLPGATPKGPFVDRMGTGTVGMLPGESHGMKTKMLVEEGQAVKIGTPLYCDRRDEEALFTSPAAGHVLAVVRGARRKVLSVQVQASGANDQVSLDIPELDSADKGKVRAALLASGLWPSLRRRPFDRVARSDETPDAIFVTASDTHPQAPAPLDVLAGREADFSAGLQVLQSLTEGAVYVCTLAGEDWSSFLTEGVQHQAFAGKHPAGNAGVHINALRPVGAARFVWHIGYQDLADIGQLFRTKSLPTTRVVGISGPGSAAPVLVRTRRGAALDELACSPSAKQPRVIVGSVLGGRAAVAEEGFLGRYANQVTILEDTTERKFLAWAFPFAGRHSVSNAILDKLFNRELLFDTDLNGSDRAIVPTGTYERVMPMDIMATQLVKALASGDLETAEKLGVMELAEEDVALCEYVCPSKTNITGLLRDMLTRIEVEG